MNFIKQNTKPNFKEFNDEWAIAGNYSYTIQFNDKERALDVEDYLNGIGFKIKHSSCYSDWNHHSRKYFNIGINPKNKFFFRKGRTETKEPSHFKNIYFGDYFKNFCFKFVITEKVKK